MWAVFSCTQKLDPELQKLEDILKLINKDFVTDADLLEVLKSLKGKLDGKDKELEESIAALEKGLREDMTIESSDVRDQLGILRQKIKDIKLRKGDKGDRGEPGKAGEPGAPGKDADSALLAKQITETIEKDLPKFGTAFRDGLELLQGDERLDKSAVKGLDEEFTKVRGEISSIPSGGGGGGRRSHIRQYSLSSLCDGVTKSFTLPPKTINVIGVFGTQFPINFEPFTDWTFNNNTLTLGSSVSAPESGQTLWILIETLFII